MFYGFYIKHILYTVVLERYKLGFVALGCVGDFLQGGLALSRESEWVRSQI
jgi:hypothetical protein